MPNRSVHVEGAGLEELTATLQLAFGPLKMTAYRIDFNTMFGDRLLLATDAKLIIEFDNRCTVLEKGYVNGHIASTPTMPVSNFVGFVDSFLDTCNKPPSPDIDGSVRDDAFLVRTVEPWGMGVLVIVTANWREFHK